uniref:NAC domain-containing protein n=1 Tax=Oryza barthii TaxID=65489 RepID=A0A0D3FR72_9ORYZ
MDDDEIALEPGYAFRPSDDGLVTLFLRPKIAKIPFEHRLINHADVYSTDPTELVGEHRPAPGTHGSSRVWYFFCSPRYTSKRKASGRRQRAPGYVFHPSDDGLITLFLRPSIAKIPFEDRLINHADVYSADPAELVGEHRPAPGTHGSSSVWRKTSGRRQRAVGGGCENVWKSEGGKKAVIGADGRRVGYLQKFSYGVYESSSSGSARSFTRLGWCMTEYGLDDDAIDGADKQVLCKVYRSPRAVCAEARTAAAKCSGSKRKADDGADHPEAPPSARPRQEEAGSEHDEQPELPPELDLDALLSAPMDENLESTFSTAATEQYMRYLMNDEPLPWAPTMDPVDGGAGGGDEFIQTANGPCMDGEVFARLAAGETLDDILGSTSS